MKTKDIATGEAILHGVKTIQKLSDEPRLLLAFARALRALRNSKAIRQQKENQMSNELDSAIHNYIDASANAYRAAEELQNAAGLDDSAEDPETGWTLAMWLTQGPLYTRKQIDELLKKFTSPTDNAAQVAPRSRSK